MFISNNQIIDISSLANIGLLQNLNQLTLYFS